MSRLTLPLTALLAMLAAPALAQQAAAPAATAPTDTAPAANAPQLTVATVRMNGGIRASKIIGATVTNDHNESIGTIDDLMVADQDRVAFAVISVGGFLGIGSKLVAVPYGQLNRAANGRILWPGASKQSLAQMPSFTYGG